MTFYEMGEIKGGVVEGGGNGKSRLRFRADNFEMLLRHPRDC